MKNDAPKGREKGNQMIEITKPKEKAARERVLEFENRKRHGLDWFHIEAPASEVQGLLVREGVLADGEVVSRDALKDKFNSLILDKLRAA